MSSKINASRILFNSAAITLFSICAASTQAKPDFNWYGHINVSVDYLDTNQKQASGEANISSNATFLGIRGRQAFDDRLAAIWQLESDIDVTNGTWTLTRDSFLGLDTKWGTVKIGQFDTPLKVLRNKTDLFGNQLGDARNLTDARNITTANGTQTTYGIIDRRFKNSIAYQTPVLYGVKATIHYSANTATNTHGNNGGGTQDVDDRALSGSIEYSYEKLWFAVAADHSSNNTQHQNIVRVAASYDTEVAKCYVLAQGYSDNQRQSYLFGFGTKVPVTKKWALKGQAYRFQVKHNQENANMFAIGADYTYNKFLSFYIDGAVVDNKNMTATPFQVAHSAHPLIDLVKDPSATDTNPWGLSVGAIFKF